MGGFDQVLVVLSSLWDVAVDIISIVGTTSVESIAGVSRSLAGQRNWGVENFKRFRLKNRSVVNH